MEKQTTKWTMGALLICERCGKSFIPGTLKEPGEPAENLKKYLKSQLKDQGLSGDIRVMTSSCLGICEDNKQALTYLPSAGPGVETYTVHPEEDREVILDYLKGKLET